MIKSRGGGYDYMAEWFTIAKSDLDQYKNQVKQAAAPKTFSRHPGNRKKRK